MKLILEIGDVPHNELPQITAARNIGHQAPGIILEQPHKLCKTKNTNYQQEHGALIRTDTLHQTCRITNKSTSEYYPKLGTQITNKQRVLEQSFFLWGY